MQTPKHTSIATVGDLVERAERRQQRRRTTMGLAVARHTNILALTAALLLTLGALAAATVFQLQPAASEVRAPAPIVVAAPWTGTCRSDVAGCVPDEMLVPGVPAAPAPNYASDYGTEFDPFVIANSQRRYVAAQSDSGSDYGTAYDPFVIENSRVRYTPSTPAVAPSPYTGPCRSDIAGCVPDEEFIPGFTGFREDHRPVGASGLPGFTDFREDHRP